MKSTSCTLTLSSNVYPRSESRYSYSSSSTNRIAPNRISSVSDVKATPRGTQLLHAARELALGRSTHTNEMTTKRTPIDFLRRSTRTWMNGPTTFVLTTFGTDQVVWSPPDPLSTDTQPSQVTDQNGSPFKDDNTMNTPLLIVSSQEASNTLTTTGGSHLLDQDALVVVARVQSDTMNGVLDDASIDVIAVPVVIVSTVTPTRKRKSIRNEFEEIIVNAITRRRVTRSTSLEQVTTSDDQNTPCKRMRRTIRRTNVSPSTTSVAANALVDWEFDHIISHEGDRYTLLWTDGSITTEHVDVLFPKEGERHSAIVEYHRRTRDDRMAQDSTDLDCPLPPALSCYEYSHAIRHKPRRPIPSPLSAAEQAAEDLIWTFNPLDYQH